MESMGLKLTPEIVSYLLCPQVCLGALLALLGFIATPNSANRGYHIANYENFNVSPDFGEPTKLSHLAFREIPISNIETIAAFSCYTVATLDILHNWNSLLGSVLYLFLLAS